MIFFMFISTAGKTSAIFIYKSLTLVYHIAALSILVGLGIYVVYFPVLNVIDKLRMGESYCLVFKAKLSPWY